MHGALADEQSQDMQIAGAHVVLLEEVLAQARGHEHPAGLRVRTEVRLAALTPRGRHIRVELHCAPIKHTKGAGGVAQEANVKLCPTAVCRSPRLCTEIYAYVL